MSKITLAQPSISKTSVVDIFIIFIGVKSGWLDKTNKPATRHVCGCGYFAQNGAGAGAENICACWAGRGCAGCATGAGAGATA